MNLDYITEDDLLRADEEKLREIWDNRIGRTMKRGLCLMWRYGHYPSKHKLGLDMLREDVDVATSYAYESINRMEERGFIEIVEDEEYMTTMKSDGCVKLTEKGSKAGFIAVRLEVDFDDDFDGYIHDENCEHCDCDYCDYCDCDDCT